MGGFTSAKRSTAVKTMMEPGMLMINKQVSEEILEMCGSLPRTKCLKLNPLSISLVGYHGAEKR
jgi:hypothetical protein